MQKVVSQNMPLTQIYCMQKLYQIFSRTLSSFAEDINGHLLYFTLGPEQRAPLEINAALHYTCKWNLL